MKKDIKEILKKLGIDALDESQQEEVRGKFNAIIDMKVEENTEKRLEKEKAKLDRKYEKMFESYKDDITKKFSDFIDEMLEEEIKIPKKVLENARKGELYGDLVEEFKLRLAIDEDVLSSEVKSLLGEAKKEIISLQKQVNKVQESNLKHKSDARDFALEIYKRKKVEEMGLGRKEKKYVYNLLEDSKTKKDIDNKVKYIAESNGISVSKGKESIAEEKIKRMKAKARKGKTSVNERKKNTEEDDTLGSRTAEFAKSIGWN